MPDEHKAVTGRPNDLEIKEQEPALPNSTMAQRKAARLKASKKAVQSAENKAVEAEESKAAPRQAAKK